MTIFCIQLISRACWTAGPDAVSLAPVDFTFSPDPSGSAITIFLSMRRKGSNESPSFHILSAETEDGGWCKKACLRISATITFSSLSVFVTCHWWNTIGATALRETPKSTKRTSALTQDFTPPAVYAPVSIFCKTNHIHILFYCLRLKNIQIQFFCLVLHINVIYLFLAHS